MKASWMMLALLTLCSTGISVHADSTRRATLNEGQDITELARMHDPDAQVTAALMQPTALFDLHGDDAAPSEARVTNLLMQAQHLDPTAPDITALTMISCDDSRVCDAVDLGDRLHDLDPDNAFSWMPRLQRDIVRDNPNSVTQALQRMAQSKRFDSYWVHILQRVQHGMTLLPLSASSSESKLEQIDYALSLAGAVIPNFQDLIHACKPDNSAFEIRRASCRSIGVMMESSPMFITNMIGATLHRWAARDPSDYDRALDVTRNLIWVETRFGDVAVNDMSLHDTEVYLHDIKSSGTESGAMRLVLQRVQIPIQAPKDWTNRQLRYLMKTDHNALPASARSSN